MPENVYGKERFLANRTESPETSVEDPDPDPQDPHVFGPSGFKTEDNVPASSYKGKYGEKFFFYILHVTEERSQRYVSADLDPHQNVTDPQHCLKPYRRS